MTRHTLPSWLDANQSYLVEEFKRLKKRLDREGDEERPRWDDRLPLPAIDRLCELFELSPFERDVLLLCAGVEMDSEIAHRSAESQGSVQRAYATFGLCMAALADPHWSALTHSRPLRRFRLLDLESGRGVTTAPLRIDERVLHYLAGVNTLDARLESTIAAAPNPDWIAPEHETIAARLAKLLEVPTSNMPLVCLFGDDPDGQEDVAARALRAHGTALYICRAEDLPALGPELDQFMALWRREALMLPAALLIQCGSGGLTPSARHVAERLPELLFVASRETARLARPVVRMDVDKPGPAEQKRIWQRTLGESADTLNGVLDDLSEQFRLSARNIRAASERGVDDLWGTCRSFGQPKLEELAQRLDTVAGWDDLVLPDLQMQTLKQLASQVRHRMKVYESWGFSTKGKRGLGVSALFTGESGTGKTMAAEVLAKDLGLDLYRIDLSAVVSKYIGETEKNLKQVFDGAEDGGAVLLFDEADALFGKRTDVKDSHDRYANIEVGYLLQRMEAYQGLAILTTNMKSSLDRAFQRRLRFIVNFPFPDAGLRAAIWSRVFPSLTPTRGLDPVKLGQLNMAGGSIRNIALNAAFLAAESDKEVTMDHVFQAARLEAQKTERALSEAETRGWVS